MENQEMLKIGESSNKNNLMVPISIVIAGILIAGAVYFGNRGTQNGNIANAPQPQQAPTSDASGLEKVKSISKDDHILGNPNASVKIITFEDTECPFCKRFHPTLQQMMSEYGKDGRVAWVYRHFPLDAIHSKARKEAEATECANELGGNTKFWAYLDRLFEITPSNNNLDPAELPKIATYVGLGEAKFTACLNSGKYAQHVADNLADATASGGQGTPWSIIIAQNGKKFPLSGAQPYAAVKTIIEEALKKK